MSNLNAKKFIHKARDVVKSRLDYFESDIHSMLLGGDPNNEEYRTVIINDIIENLMSIVVEEEEENESEDRGE